jgi:hypothetical protein
MKLSIVKILLVIGAVSVFSQFSMADPASAQKTIASIVAGMSHFPSDAQKEELQAIADDESSGSSMQMIASTVINIQHAASAEGKAAMGQIIANDGAPNNTRALAKIVMEFNHIASAGAKEILAAL